MPQSKIAEVISQHESDLLTEWNEELQHELRRSGSTMPVFAREASRAFVSALREILLSSASDDIMAPEWQPIRSVLEDLSRRSAEAGFSPSQTATFVFSFKLPLFSRLRQAHEADMKGFGDEIWRVTRL